MTAPIDPGSGRSVAFAPFTVPAFRLLWFAALVSNIGGWMQTVGAQWLLVQADSPPAVIALVSTASAAPVLLFALPTGVLGEFFNRRLVLLYSQAVQLTVVVVLTALTAAGETTPPLLLILTFMLGIVSAVQLPAFQAIVPDVVPARMIGDAASLSSVGVNVARAIGPAVAGLVVSGFGVTAVFALNAASFVVYLLALGLWRGYTPPVVRPEPFIDATRAGLRYVVHSRVVRSTLLRLALFVIPANAMWALLPVLADGALGLPAAGYGLLLAAIGVGSIGGAVLLPIARDRWGENGAVLAGSLLYGAGLIALALSDTLWVTLPVLTLTGLAWIGVIASINGAVQSFLPVWVRTRGLSLYQLVLFGSTAVGSAIAGALASPFGAAPVTLGAGALIVGLGVSLVIRPLPDGSKTGRGIVAIPGLDGPDTTPPIAPASGRGDASTSSSTAAADANGEVLVLISYTVPVERREAFVAVMASLEQSRHRTGARRWTLYQDHDDSGVLVEAYAVGSWREHVSQHEGRTTEFDGELIAQARSFSTVPPTARHLIAVQHPAKSTSQRSATRASAAHQRPDVGHGKSRRK